MKTHLIVGALSMLSVTAAAQQDVGQILQQSQEPPLPPRPSAPLQLHTPPRDAPAVPGGEVIPLSGVILNGYSVFNEKALLQAIGPVQGRSFDLAGLRGLADRVTQHYRQAGYPFARAYLPAQRIQDGVLRIEIVEGRYGRVQLQAKEPSLAEQAKPFLADLVPGMVIDSASLERASLLLDDLPGISTQPVIRPGEQPGTGELLINILRDHALHGSLGLDNHGNRYSGYHRLRLNVEAGSLATLGDQLGLQILHTDEELWLGSLNYALPLGASGLRASLGYAHTQYQLGRDFASLGANGTAKVSSLGLNYPLQRSRQFNLNLTASLQYKELHDNQDSTLSRATKSSATMPVSLQFDHRDELFGGGLNYGVLSLTGGHLTLDDALTAADSAKTRGRFAKASVDVIRMQALPTRSSLYLRVNAQWAGKNLDSSESFSPGGATGVRAYPTGEANGDEGWLTQLELRHSFGDFAPYLFYDAAEAKTNARPIDNALNRRKLAGYGAGLRWQRQTWSTDLALAWRSEGGNPQSDSGENSQPRVWVSVSYRY